MDTQEQLVDERSRLGRLGVSVSILSILLASWARDPSLDIKLPLAGAEVDNLTAGHAILIGFPLVTFLILWVAGQAMRVDALTGHIPPNLRTSMAWRAPPSSVKPAWLASVVGGAAVVTRYLVIILVPFVASLILFTSYFDFKVCDAEKPNCGHAEEVSTVAYLFTGQLWAVKPSYISLDNEECAAMDSACAERNDDRAKIRRHLPYLYAPLQSWFYIVFELLNIAAFGFLSLLYFRREREA